MSGIPKLVNNQDDNSSDTFVTAVLGTEDIRKDNKIGLKYILPQK